ncbi:hypothetical protein PTSG_12721 [Salpingoeca rosetta]|uniref:Uncharacterized protein n=1 Tax=Salpingoeca rosetta (strain ATCC 50818 / BSB-021) TaxID=946362 RepID=F2UJM1_SALR5|nr:uncharacterized protein PTSG_12721 [Salpingoeca rosetta]EGD77320.1 hypothetical protein PTSG_12721 [Salpingoeca rosetta]|eukprot:XP_004990664.1 hypothetical protein PTSG_12721 [Salpingoeca rosetta]
MSLLTLQEKLVKLKSSKTKKAGEDVFDMLKNADLLLTLDDNTLDHITPTWQDVVEPYVTSCGNIGSRVTATIFQFEHLNKILECADARFKQHGTTMLPEKFMHQVLKKMLQWLKEPARVHYVVNILLRRIFIHDAYVACMSAALIDKFMQICLPAVREPGTWAHKDTCKLVELFKWLLCDSPALIQQRIIHSKNRHDIQDALHDTLERLGPAGSAAKGHFGTLKQLLRGCRAYTLLLAHQGQLALAHWAKDCARRLLDLILSSNITDDVRTQAVQTLRVFLAARSCADSKLLSSFTSLVTSELPRLLFVRQRLASGTKLSPDNHAFAAFIADLLAIVPAFSNSDERISVIPPPPTRAGSRASATQLHTTGAATAMAAAVGARMGRLRLPSLQSRSSARRPHDSSSSSRSRSSGVGGRVGDGDGDGDGDEGDAVVIDLENPNNNSSARSSNNNSGRASSSAGAGDAEPPRLRAKRKEGAIATLLRWLGKQEEAAIVLTTYLVERHADKAGLPFIKQAIRGALPLIREGAGENSYWGLRCVAALLHAAHHAIKRTTQANASNSPTSAHAPGAPAPAPAAARTADINGHAHAMYTAAGSTGTAFSATAANASSTTALTRAPTCDATRACGVLGFDEELDAAYLDALSALRALLVGAAVPSSSLHARNALWRALVVYGSPDVLRDVDISPLIHPDPVTDDDVDFLLPLLHTPSGHHHVTQSPLLEAVISWLCMPPIFTVFTVFTSTCASSWAVAKCLALLCSTKAAPPSLLVPSSNESPAHVRAAPTVGGAESDGANASSMIDRELSELEDAYLFNRFTAPNHVSDVACMFAS